jgi:hypothetical protein
MQPTQSRWTIVIALVMAAIGALFVWLRQPAAEIIATPPVIRTAPQPAPEVLPTAAVPTQAAKQAPAAAEAVDESVGRASSTIHFEHAAALRS